MSKKHLNEVIQAAQTEEELKFYFANYFQIMPSTKNRVDLYTEQILYEFKLDSNLNNLQVRAKTAAQALYYVRRLKLGDDDRAPSQFFCLVSKNSAVYFQTELFADFFNNNSYDWDLKPSNPCKKLVAELINFDSLIRARVFDLNNFNDCLAFEIFINNNRKRKSSRSNVKKQINALNFYQVFQYWQSFFGADVSNGHKPSEYFITDIEQGKSHIHDGKVYFELAGEQIKVKIINPDAYNYFWSTYEKITSSHEIISIRTKMDVMTEINLRRRTGEFYTPINFARKAFDYITRTVKLDKNYRIWDMAAGTGNLEFAIPPDFINNCYISTLIEDEANYCKELFSEATVFQYDFLNDGEDKLPKKLQDDLNNPDIKWIIFINPPYATASNKDLINKISKPNVSMTAIRQQMNAENLGEVSRELFSQFIYRISRDFADKKAWLGIFSTPKYINSNNDQKFRDKFFSAKFECGFLFSSKNFQGCIGNFSVGFIVWDLNKKIPLEKQDIWLDVYNSDVEKYAVKSLNSINRKEFLSKWFERPPATKKFPPMSGALNIAEKNKDRRDRIAENFLASLMCKGNDISNQGGTAILSGPYVSAGGISIIANNFERCMIIHAVHRLPKKTWLNDRDQFLQPIKELSREFISDAVIWSLFSSSNQTVSLRNVEYEGEIYQIRNNFYPFLLSEVSGWDCSSLEMARRLETATEDRFAALWIKNNRLSSEAAAILESARTIYKKFYASLNKLDVLRWKIESWDAGWYQIRMSLGESLNLETLSDKLLPQIYELGFLRDEVRYF